MSDRYFCLPGPWSAGIQLTQADLSDHNEETFETRNFMFRPVITMKHNLRFVGLLLIVVLSSLWLSTALAGKKQNPATSTQIDEEHHPSKMQRTRADQQVGDLTDQVAARLAGIGWLC